MSTSLQQDSPFTTLRPSKHRKSTSLVTSLSYSQFWPQQVLATLYLLLVSKQKDCTSSNSTKLSKQSPTTSFSKYTLTTAFNGHSLVSALKIRNYVYLPSSARLRKNYQFGLVTGKLPVGATRLSWKNKDKGYRTTKRSGQTREKYPCALASKSISIIVTLVNSP